LRSILFLAALQDLRERADERLRALLHRCGAARRVRRRSPQFRFTALAAVASARRISPGMDLGRGKGANRVLHRGRQARARKHVHGEGAWGRRLARGSSARGLACAIGGKAVRSGLGV
jgi:hypothetical protein